MVFTFDLKYFYENLKATKPPYECPVKDCGKVYKTYAGIEFHLHNYDHENPENNISGSPSSGAGGSGGRRGAWNHKLRSPTSGSSPRAAGHPSFLHSLSRDTNNVDFDTQEIVEVDVNGKTYRIDIFEPLEVIIKDDAETGMEKDAAAERSGMSSVTVKASSAENPSPRKEPTLSPGRLPEAHFKILEDYIAPKDVPSQTASYYRFIERTNEELEEQIDYDMDEEDVIWLDLVNRQRVKQRVAPVSRSTFEFLMDRFEKKSYLEPQTGLRDGAHATHDEDAVCCVCLDGEWHVNNVILFCDLCNIAVHQECYGVPHIPDGPWVCRRCLHSPSKPVDCCLCPSRRGAMKQTETGLWAHVVCAAWIPEVGFANSVFLEPIDGIERIAAARWKLACYICKQRGTGACIQCHKTSCYTAFHVTCAQEAGLYMRTDPIRDSRGSLTLSGAMTSNVKKTAFCDVHSPNDEGAAASDSSGEDSKESMSSLLPAEAKARSKQKLRRARKAVTEERGACPTLSVPVVSPSSFLEIARQVSMEQKVAFIRQLDSYWKLKRESKCGVPLIHTPHHTSATAASHLENAKSLFNSSNPNKDLVAATPTATEKKHLQSDSSSIPVETKPSDMKPLEQFKICKRLRQELERVRLLNELIRKREKLKHEQMRVHETAVMLQLQPLVRLLRRYVEKLKNLLANAHHMSPEMDWSSIEERISLHQLTSVHELSVEFIRCIDERIEKNAGNPSQIKRWSIFKNKGAALLKSAKRLADSAGYDTRTGIHADSVLISESGSPLHARMKCAGKKRPHGYDLKMLDEDSQSSCKVDERKRVCMETENKKTASNSTTAISASTTTTTSSPATLNLVSLSRRPAHGVNRRTSVLHSKKAQRYGLGLPPRVSTTTITGTAAVDKTLPKLHHASPLHSPEATKVEGQPAMATSIATQPAASSSSAASVHSTTLKKNAHATPIICSDAALVKTGIDQASAIKTTSSKDRAVTKDDFHSGNAKCTKPQKTPVVVGRGKRSKDIKIVQKDKTAAQVLNKNIRKKYAAVASSVRGKTKVDKLAAALSSAILSADQHSGPRVSTQKTNRTCPIAPLDLVWAKCRGYPPYPGLVVDPKTPKSGYMHRGVVIPAPPAQVLRAADSHAHKLSEMFLVLFFDVKRTWQWMRREQLELLGIDSELDRTKLLESKKASASMREATQAAYDRAIEHRNKVAGD